MEIVEILFRVIIIPILTLIFWSVIYNLIVSPIIKKYVKGKECDCSLDYFFNDVKVTKLIFDGENFGFRLEILKFKENEESSHTIFLNFRDISLKDKIKFIFYNKIKIKEDSMTGLNLKRVLYNNKLIK